MTILTTLTMLLKACHLRPRNSYFLIFLSSTFSFGKQGLEDDKTYKQEQGKGKGKVI